MVGGMLHGFKARIVDNKECYLFKDREHKQRCSSGRGDWISVGPVIFVVSVEVSRRVGFMGAEAQEPGLG